MCSKTNRAVALRMSDEVVNQRRMEVVDQLLADNYIYHGTDGLTMEGREGFKQMISAFQAGFPDLKSDLLQVSASDDLVTLLYTFEGTNTESFMGMPVTGKKIKIQGIILRRFENGKIVEDWDMYDYPTFMKQLGIM